MPLPRPRPPAAAVPARHRPPRRTARLASAPDPGNSAPPPGVPMATGAPKLTKKPTSTSRSARTRATTPGAWRRPRACRRRRPSRGTKLTVTDANNDQSEADLRHQGPHRAEAGRPVHRPDHRAAGQRGDRGRTRPASRSSSSTATSTTASAKPGEAFVTVISLGLRPGGQAGGVGDGQATGGNAKIIELEGTTGRVAGDRPQEGLRRRHHAVPRHAGRGLAVRRLHPGQGPVGRRDPAAVTTRTPPRSTPTTTRWRSARSRPSRPPARFRARTSRSSRSTARRTASRRSPPATSTRPSSATRASARSPSRP